MAEDIKQKLNEIVEAAKQVLGSNLISVLITGTGAIEQDFVEGYSDYDIALVVHQKSKDVQKAVGQLLLDDRFLINIITPDQLELDSGLWPFSDKFRTKCLYGKDLVSRVELPSSSASKARLKAFIIIQENKLFSRVANVRFWSEGKIKKEAYVILKHVLLSYSIYHFLKNGVFPKSRKEIYSCGSDAVKQLTVLMHNWLSVKKDHILEALPALEEVVSEIREFCEG